MEDKDVLIGAHISALMLSFQMCKQYIFSILNEISFLLDFQIKLFHFVFTYIYDKSHMLCKVLVHRVSICEAQQSDLNIIFIDWLFSWLIFVIRFV